MERDKLDTGTLGSRGFQPIGRWSLNAAGRLVLDGAAPACPGVYAFAIDGIVHYVGLASANLERRLTLYARPGPTQRTNSDHEQFILLGGEL